MFLFFCCCCWCRGWEKLPLVQAFGFAQWQGGGRRRGLGGRQLTMEAMVLHCWISAGVWRHCFFAASNTPRLRVECSSLLQPDKGGGVGTVYQCTSRGPSKTPTVLKCFLVNFLCSLVNDYFQILVLLQRPSPTTVAPGCMCKQLRHIHFLLCGWRTKYRIQRAAVINVAACHCFLMTFMFIKHIARTDCSGTPLSGTFYKHITNYRYLFDSTCFHI